ncbi:hypothetical protein ONE63_011164 [Megalurothrips usitatus]|uniref:Uncharacterized protein n=1 Tax=Megalurothrips usitatus TaxID=439358 RepID=A0AAV7X3B0_9NEOP|nr:hypothetical protein ONE63_011164 [Megalurothrips usitatus]
MYAKLEEHGVTVHSSRLKERLLNDRPYLQSCGTPGQNAFISFKKDINHALRADCTRSSGDLLALDKAADILRKTILTCDSETSVTEVGTRSAPELLRRFVSRLLDGSSTPADDDQVVTTLTELVVFHTRKKKRVSVRRHDADRETPTPVYVASKLHGATRKRKLVDVTFQLGLSISYDRLKSILTQRANRACQRYRQDGVVCPEKLQCGVFTTACVDNLDHNTSSTTAKGAFHGTAISLMQHGPSGEDRIVTAAAATDSRNAVGLPAEYSVVVLEWEIGPVPDLSVRTGRGIHCRPLSGEVAVARILQGEHNCKHLARFPFETVPRSA